MKIERMFVIAQNEDGVWISERTKEGYEAMDSPDYKEHPEWWKEWSRFISVEECLKELAGEMKNE